MTIYRADLAALVAETALALDDGDFSRFMDMLTHDFRYRVLVESAELRREVAWLDQTHDGLAALFAALPDHLLRPGRLHRFAVPARIIEEAGAWCVTSTLLIHATDQHGVTKPLAVGRYHDNWRFENGALRLGLRDVRLDTRDIGIGSHVPF